MSSSMEANDRYQQFEGDRYERLCQAAEVLVHDPVFVGAPYPLDATGLSALVNAISRHRLLDHLADSTANAVIAMLLVDFHQGPLEVAARIRSLLAGAERGMPDYDTLAIVSGLAAVLALMVDPTGWLSTSRQDVDGIKLT